MALFFASNLNAEVNNGIHYVWIGQGGVNAAYVIHDKSRFHPWCQLNIVFFLCDTIPITLGFSKQTMHNLINGLIVSPQIFCELVVTEWFKNRTGLSYNLYSFKDFVQI
jgi:hypothetical protein